MSLIHGAAAAALLACLSQVAHAQQDRLRMYGYFDLELEWSNRDAAGRRWTFDQHHFNIVTVYRIDHRWRVFGEVEWEHGVSLSEGGGAGLVALERAWAEYKHSDGLKLKVGKFLSPFGIYNLRHDATPTLLATFLSNSVYGEHANTTGETQRLYAKFSTGIQVLGTLFGGRWSGDYYLYLTNGRGGNPAERDDNGNKGLGGRLLVRFPDEILRVGLSYYTDRNGLAQNTQQRSLAADLAVEDGAFLLEAEAFEARLERVDISGAPAGTHRTGYGYYGQGSYRFRDWITPFARYEFYDPDRNAVDDGEWAIVAGLNFMITPSAYLKSELQLRRFQSPATPANELFVSSLSVAF